MKTVTSPNLLAGDQVFSIVIKSPRKFARGGLVKAATKVREAGRYGDDVLVHMNQAEFEQIKKSWGMPTYNPKTGLPEYFSLGSLVGPAISLGLGILGAKHSGAAGSGPQAPASDPNLTAHLPQWVNNRTVIPHTNPSDYFTYGQTGNPNPGEWNFFGHNSLADIGAPTPPPPPKPVMHGGPRGFAGGGLADFAAQQQGQTGQLGNAAGMMGGLGAFGQRPPAQDNWIRPNILPAAPPGMPPPPPGGGNMYGGGAGPGGNQPPPFFPTPQMGGMAAPPPGGPQGTPATMPPNQYGMRPGAPGGAGSMPGSSMALQRPQGPAGGPPLGGLGGGYARPQPGMSGWQQRGGRAFADGGPVAGPGTGRSDHIPARLSDGEYVIDAETTALLGDGSTNAGAAKLDAMRKAIRQHKGAALAKGKFTPKAKMPLDYLNDMKARDDMNANLRRGIK